jgi:hypothetical protein
MPLVPTRAKPRQSAPNRSNAPHARTPAQNEATPHLFVASSFAPSRSHPYAFTCTYSRSTFPSFAVHKKYPLRGSKL